MPTLTLPRNLVAHAFNFLLDQVALKRAPDFIVGADNPDGAYLHRWYLTPWRGWYRDVAETARTPWQRLAVAVSRLLPNVYLHEFLRDDDDRALHDHPWGSASLLLSGSYVEHTIAAGGIHHRVQYNAGTLRTMRARHAHRIELLRHVVDYGDPATRRAIVGRCWTLFVTSPVLRAWGFHCPQRGWVHWQQFTADDDRGAVGAGCDA